MSKRIKSPLISNSFKAEKENGIFGEMTFVFKTKIAQQYPYPIFPGEKFIKESIVYRRISTIYDFLYIPESLVQAEYLEDGLTAQSRNLLIKNPKGAALSFLETANNPNFDLEKRLVTALNYWDYETLSGNKSFTSKLSKIKGLKMKFLFLKKKFIR